MLETYEADVMIREAMGQAATKQVALESAAGRVFRRTVRAKRDQPPYYRAPMDGVALRAILEHLGTTDGFSELPPGAGHAPVGTPVVFHGW